MSLSCSKSFTLIAFVLSVSAIAGCTGPSPWPDSPLYEPPTNDPNWQPPANKEQAIEEMAGHYAHYDVVAYQGATPNGPLSTFIISYGFTDLIIEGEELVQYDRFCHAEQKANQDFVSTFPDAATQAILPRSTVVEVREVDGEWTIFRPATPTLIGVDGNPDEPLTMDRNDPQINDADNDGRPGVTVFVTLFGFIKGEIYIARREIFQNDVTLYSDGSLRGSVTDDSEQFVIGASIGILDAPNDPDQFRDPGLNPIILIPIADEIDTCEELMANRDELFPPEPQFR
ncbi:MAG: hypothetical protein KDA54_02765 [Phycisphaerales bacterium]|nr:hypothetical protein [Phycisphaerales bacterium]